MFSPPLGGIFWPSIDILSLWLVLGDLHKIRRWRILWSKSWRILSFGGLRSPRRLNRMTWSGPGTLYRIRKSVGRWVGVRAARGCRRFGPNHVSSSGGSRSPHPARHPSSFRRAKRAAGRRGRPKAPSDPLTLSPRTPCRGIMGGREAVGQTEPTNRLGLCGGFALSLFDKYEQSPKETWEGENYPVEKFVKSSPLAYRKTSSSNLMRSSRAYAQELLSD